MIRIVPVGGVNAVQTASFGVEWADPLDHGTFEALSILHSAVESDLPRKQEIKGTTVQVILPGNGAATAPFVSSNPTITGLLFDAVGPDGSQTESVLIQPTFVAASRNGYAGWEKTWAKARGLLRPFVTTMLNYRPISVIGQQYVNAFRVEGDVSAFRAGMVFKKESKFLPGNVFEAESFWHAHHGFFYHSEQPASHRRLSGINVDFTDENGVSIVRITTAHRAYLNQPITDVDAQEVDGLLDNWANALHDVQKACLKDLLVMDLANSIGLYKE